MICEYCGQELDYQKTEIGIEYASCECDAYVEMAINGYSFPGQPSKYKEGEYSPFLGELDSNGKPYAEVA